MEKMQAASLDSEDGGREDEPTEAVELVLFHVGECYVYLIPPRKSAASYRADEWDVNKWAWEGALKVISKGEECVIRLEDKSTGELYARAFLREGEPHPVEPVIDSSRYFVLRVEEDIGGRIRHAFIGIGFRERTDAYDFQAALHDHLKYLNKKKTAEEMEQHFQHTSSVDYSLKEGQTLVLKIKTKGSPGTRSSTADQGVSNLSLDEKSPKGSPKVALLILKPPPPPPSPLSPVASPKQSTVASPEQSANLEETAGTGAQADTGKAQEVVKDDFGDFQTAVLKKSTLTAETSRRAGRSAAAVSAFSPHPRCFWRSSNSLLALAQAMYPFSPTFFIPSLHLSPPLTCCTSSLGEEKQPSF